MFKSIFAFSLTLLFTPILGAGVQAQTSGISLTTIANRDGYSLQWLIPDRAVRLYRPGVVIVIRPGERMYDVNDRVEFADAAPAYVNGDMLITSWLAARLGRLAAYSVARAAAPAGVRSPAPAIAAAGPITLDVSPQRGSEALHVRGRSPSSEPVTITLTATISPDLPTVVLSRNYVQPDASGEFVASIPIAPDYLHGTFIEVLATALGATPARATVTVGAPNAGITVPFDKPYCTDIVCPI